MSAGDESDYEEGQQEQDEMIIEGELDGDDGVDIMDEEAVQEQPNLKIQHKVGDRTCATYTFDGEDHTLGNLLRFALIKDHDVEFCGYSITHPSEHTINMRLQTTGKGTNELLIRGLENINFMVDVTERKFAEALAKHKQKKNGGAVPRASKQQM